MCRQGIAFLAATMVLVGCGSTPTTRSSDIGVSATNTYTTQISTDSAGSLASTITVLPGATDSQVASPVPSSTPSPAATDAPSPSPSSSASPLPSPSPNPTAQPGSETLLLGSLVPMPSPSPSAPAAQASPLPQATSLPDGVADQIVSQWTTGWALLGTQRAHVDLLVNYFPASFFAPPAHVTVQIAWTLSGTVVNTTDYGPWVIPAPNSDEATFDAPVESDGAQIQILPAQ